MDKKPQKFAAFDLDGTLFRASLSRMLMIALIEQGLIDKKLLEELDPYYYTWKNREHPDAFREYDLQHIEMFSKYIEGVHVDDVRKVALETVKKIYKKVYVYTRDLAERLHDDGYFLIAITASPHEISQPFAAQYDFDVVIADNIRCDKNGRCIDAKTTSAFNKRGVLKELISNYDLTLEDSYAIGDTASDIGMFELVENPIVFNPSKELFNVAKEHNWPVIVERKNMIYELAPQKGKYIIK